MATLVKESIGLASVAEVIPLSSWWEAWLHTAGPEAVAENHILIHRYRETSVPHLLILPSSSPAQG